MNNQTSNHKHIIYFSIKNGNCLIGKNISLHFKPMIIHNIKKIVHSLFIFYNRNEIVS